MPDDRKLVFALPVLVLVLALGAGAALAGSSRTRPTRA